MPISLLTLFSGLFISFIGEYFSILGLMAIFSASPIPAAVMGIALGFGKISSTLWLKQNWKISPILLKIYLIFAIIVLMVITSIGCFGFLSKAHNDQSLVSGDIQSKIFIYDEKIKTAKENIETDRKQLKQMDEAVDQIMARSTTEEGAARSNNIRKSQQRDRITLAKDIETNQKLIASLNDEAAPIRTEVRKVESEVGPIKYLAAFFYGQTDQGILEKSVTWIILILIAVFDPLAVVLLLSSQISFQNLKEKKKKTSVNDFEQNNESVLHSPDTHPYLRSGFKYPDNWNKTPVVSKKENDYVDNKSKNKQPISIKQLSNIAKRTKIFKKPRVVSTITEQIIQTALEKTPNETTPVVPHTASDYVVIDGQTYHKNSVPTSFKHLIK